MGLTGGTNDPERSSGHGGITFLHALTVLFVGLKLTGHIGWSWWLVLAPLAVPWAAALLLAFAAFTTAILELLVDVARRWFGRSE